MADIKDIEGYEGLYAVTKDGRVWSYPKKGGTNSKGGWLKGRNSGGYYQVALLREGKYKYKLIHRLVMEAFIENTENKPQVNHMNGDKGDNHVNNLEWVTCSENHLHAFRTGLNKHSEKAKEAGRINIKKASERNRKFSIDIASEICEAFETGIFSHKEIAEYFNVTSQTIHNLIKGKTYA